MFDDRDDERQEKEHEKLSWSEIDKLRNKSQHVQREKRPGKKDYELIKKKNEELAALEGLFGDHKPDKEQSKYLKAIREAKNKDEFSKAVARHERKFDLPKDWGTLLLLLDHKESRIVLHALNSLRPLFPHRIPEEKELLLSHLNVLKMTTRDADVEESVEEFLGSVG